MNRSRWCPLFLPVLLTASLTSAADLAPATGLNSLPEVPFAQLTHQDRSLLAARALALNAQDWKHAETEHFVYHFQHSYVATPVAVEAEFHFRVVTKELGKTAVPGAAKAHIYIFERPPDWEAFQTVGGLEPWTGGIQAGGSLFIVRNPAYKFTDNTLGHEIAHLLLRGFYGNNIPIWLNEGFAQYVSKGAHASYQRARGYLAKPSSQAVERGKLFPLSTLTRMSYPPAADVNTFYDQSERLVRFLAATDKAQFLQLLELHSTGTAFEAALERTFGAKFSSIAALEEQFRTYASKDAGSAFVQDR